MHINPNADSRLGKLFYVIPDTCWLLKAPTDDFRPWPRYVSWQRPRFNLCESIPLKYLPRTPWTFLRMIKNLINEPIRYVDVQATWVILDEVTTEITKLHEDNAATGTGHAKDTLREIMCSCPFERHSAKNAPKAELIEGKLGLDSPTDHAILSYAIALAETTPVTRVVILTYDSGLRLEIASQARERGRRISTDLGGPCDSESYYDKVSDYLLHELGIGRIT